MTTSYTGPVSSGDPESGRRSQSNTYTMSKTKEVVRSGITMGSALAITISWSVNKSILWAIIHGFFSWLYVIYYALVKR
jgi:hypothetical protein